MFRLLFAASFALLISASLGAPKNEKYDDKFCCNAQGEPGCCGPCCGYLDEPVDVVADTQAPDAAVEYDDKFCCNAQGEPGCCGPCCGYLDEPVDVVEDASALDVVEEFDETECCYIPPQPICCGGCCM